MYMRQHSKKSALHQLSSVILFLKFLLLIMGAFKRFLLLLLFGWLSSAWAFPQDQPEQQVLSKAVFEKLPMFKIYFVSVF